MIEEVLRHPERHTGIIDQIVLIVHKAVVCIFQCRQRAFIYLYGNIITHKPVVEHLEVAAVEPHHTDSDMIIEKH